MFNTPFVDFGVKKGFLLHIQECWACLENDSKFIPYFSVFQSSMTGKTRLIFELAKNPQPPFHILYCNLRDPKFLGYPLGFSSSALIINSICIFGEAWAVCFLVIAVKLYFRNILIHPLEDQSNASEFWIEVQNQANQKYQNLSKDSNLDFVISEIETIVSEHAYSSRKSNTIDTYDTECSNHKVYQTRSKSTWVKNSVSSSKVELLFVFDEAMALVNRTSENGNTTCFHIFRRAIRRVTRKSGLLVCFCDTSSAVSNFSPTADITSSYRHFKNEFRLLPPFYYFIFQPEFEVDIQVPFSAPYDEYLSTLLSLGRVGWEAYQAKYNNKLSDLLDFATIKLLCAKSMDQLTEHKLNLACLAVMGACFCLDIVPHCDFSSNLVKSHMAICIGINDDSVMSVFSTEPIIVQAALNILSYSETWEKCLDCLNAMICKGYVSAGLRGELVVRLLCIRATIACGSFSFKFFLPVKMVYWLKNLGVISATSVIPNFWDDADVFVTSFIQVLI